MQTPLAVSLPDVRSTKGDASVHYAYDRQKRWYVLKAAYNQEERVADVLIRSGVYAYVPRRYERTGEEGATVSLRSLMPSILFAYLSPAEAATLAAACQHGAPPGKRLLEYAGFLYARPGDVGSATPEPLTIDDKAMNSFILTTTTCDEHVLMLRRDSFTVKDDGEYLVTEGPFRGVMGKLIRAHRQQRILVELPSLAYLCTPYIPDFSLQKIYA